MLGNGRHDPSSHVPGIASGGPVLIGFVVMQAWKIMHGLPIVDSKSLACVLAGKAFGIFHVGLCFWSTVFWLLPGFPQPFELPAAWLGQTCIDEQLVRGAVVNIPVYAHTEGMATGPLNGQH